MKIAEVITIINNMMINEEEWGLPEGYADSLMGPRTRGSTTERGLDALPTDTECIKVQVAESVRKEGCTYLKVYAPTLNGKLGAVSLHSARQHGLVVRLGSGKHGPELIARANGFNHRETDEITIIMDRHQGHEVVSTWFPGEPLAPIPDDWDEDVANLSEFTGVKIVDY